MAVRIRLSRVGKKHVPFFRLVAVDSRKKRDGRVLAHIGTYDALENKVVQFYNDELDKWLKNGALLSDSAKKVVSLYKKSGIFIVQPHVKVARVASSTHETESVASAEAQQGEG
jgi:small subunit ribosomal protein S16